MKNEIVMSEEEVDSIEEEFYLKIEKRYKWYICTVKGNKILLPDTTGAFGFDMCGTEKLDRQSVPMSLEIMAYPSKYTNSLNMRRATTKRIKFGDLPEGYIPELQRIPP